MKLISLNVWGGRIRKELALFLEKWNGKADIFSFQEMYHQANKKMMNAQWQDDDINEQLFEDIIKLLPNYTAIFRPHFQDFWGLAIFIKNEIPIVKEGEKFVHYAESLEVACKGGTSKNIQYVTVNYTGIPLNIVNFHGLWNGQGKTDSESRILQSKEIVSFLKDMKGEIILCGDFNLRPDTKSLKIIEEFGFRNLIKENNIISTRTSHYKKEERFADYTLVTNGIKVKEFKILPEEVSDHNAMYLEIG